MLTLHSQVEAPRGSACNVVGHTGVLAPVLQLSSVDLHVTPSGEDAHASGGLRRHLRSHFRSFQGYTRACVFEI